MDIRITGAEALTNGTLERASIHVDDGVIAEIGSDCGCRALSIFTATPSKGR